MRSSEIIERYIIRCNQLPIISRLVQVRRSIYGLFIDKKISLQVALEKTSPIHSSKLTSFLRVCDFNM
jgi:hypothetical protein